MSTPENNLRLDYLEFATRDVTIANKFYTAAFGWIFTDYGPDYTSFTDGRLAGGFYTSADAPTKMNPMTVIYATDLEVAEARVIQAGGKIIKPSFEFPGGRRFQFTDPNGLELSVWCERRQDGSKIE
jgi:predicted enzyme related to lactoylglutathione lyase